MNHFEYRNGEMFAEQVPLKRIAKEVGTPAYVYSLATLKRHYRFSIRPSPKRGILCAFPSKRTPISRCSALSPKRAAVLTLFRAANFFAPSKSGADPKKIVFSGVGKKKEEIEYALNSGILMFNVESEHELFALNEIAAGIGKKAPISLRVNPDVDPQTHPYISTGMKKAKFGVDIKKSLETYKKAVSLRTSKSSASIAISAPSSPRLTPFVDALAKCANIWIVCSPER